MFAVILVVCAFGATAAIPSGYFWHITDFHVDTTYWTTQGSCNDVIANPGKYGDFECDPPWELVESSTKALLQHGGTPDFILWTGDSSPHLKDYSFSSENFIIDILRNCTNILRKHFPTTPVVVAMGNHDYFPVSQLPGEANNIYREAATMWDDWLDTAEAKETFRKSAYYTRLLPSVSSKLRVVVTNTNLYLTNNKATEGQEDPGGQFAWLEGVLEAARAAQEKVHLALHVPSGVMEQPGTPKWIRESDNIRLNNIIRNYGDVILGSYSAHQHFDSFRIFYKDEQPVASMLIAPSVTPWRARITDTLRSAARNPGVRKILFDKSSLELQDVEQYYMKLDKANDEDQATWMRLYSFKALYGLPDISTSALHQLSEGFREFANENFHNYYRMNSVDTHQPSNLPCSCDCKFEHICAIQNVNYEEFDQCRITYTCGAQRTVTSLWICALVVVRTLI